MEEQVKKEDEFIETGYVLHNYIEQIKTLDIEDSDIQIYEYVYNIEILNDSKYGVNLKKYTFDFLFKTIQFYDMDNNFYFQAVDDYKFILGEIDMTAFSQSDDLFPEKNKCEINQLKSDYKTIIQKQNKSLSVSSKIKKEQIIIPVQFQCCGIN